MTNLNAIVPTLAMGENFFESLSKLPPRIVRSVTAFISKFRNNPTSKGIHYEGIQNASCSDYRSARLNDDYRLILKHPENTNVFLLLFVAKHDDAYRWAVTHRCEVNVKTSAVQVFTVKEKEEVPKPQKTTPEVLPGFSDTELGHPTRLFASLTDDDLLSVGVPKVWLSKVQSLATQEELRGLANELPSDAFDSLLELADGAPIEEVRKLFGEESKAQTNQSVSTEEALIKPNARTLRSFKIVEPDVFLEEISAASLAAWRIFLHPSQRKLVERPALTPMLVRGVAGTGKTVVALHRAAFVANLIPADSLKKVLFTTFTKNLALDLSTQLDQICTEKQRAKIEVVNIDAWVTKFLKQNGCTARIIYPSEAEYSKAFDSALQMKSPALSFDDEFYRTEWQRIILPQAIQTEQEYLRASRKGRGVILSRGQRKEIWPVFEEMRRLLALKGLMTFEDACVMAQGLVQENPGLVQYEYVVVDETQDLDQQALKLLALVAKQSSESEPAIFLVGDSHQRIYARQASLGACGINVRGRRSTRLKLVYRTTEEIRRTAESVLLGELYDNLDGEAEGAGELKESFGKRHGTLPLILSASNAREEVDLVLEQIRENNYEDNEACVVFRTKELLQAFKSELDCRRIDNVVIKSGENSKRPGIRLSTMHRVKGLEFKLLFIADCNENVIPLNKALQSQDKAEKRYKELAERSLFYVACSRARDRLLICHTGAPSKYIKNLSSSEERAPKKKE